MTFDKRKPKRWQLLSVELFIVGVVLVLLRSSGEQRHWPFVYWDLYSGGNYSIPQSAKRVELRVLDTGGQWHSIRSMDLYTLDDDTSIQISGQSIIQRSFDDTAEERQRFRSSLVERVEAILEKEVETIEAWQYTWNIDFDKYPPLEIDQPVKTQKLGSLQVQDLSFKNND